ncbi:hypothetical protein BFV94_3680 [Alteromonas macleodii]|uniref:Uncharacterized protein n=1 Tax=Alteromonas macleodii TaxID=28108 RepID=A0AB36FQB1_ALTMA|nr:hypothetical protein BFV95_3684 [Alteromonas macleodii]OES27439.1 hypothetical protein BFV94_3680 [Alteromonas macleodii]OES27778.1 hypothetical protein BFV93_3674 [Alteromonas macleodii]OES39700.1 hypothetical protein BFV96_3669 [Alteromonas macleodii]
MTFKLLKMLVKGIDVRINVSKPRTKRNKKSLHKQALTVS